MIEGVLGTSVTALETKLLSVFVDLKEKVRKNVRKLKFLMNRNGKIYNEQ